MLMLDARRECGRKKDVAQTTCNWKNILSLQIWNPPTNSTNQMMMGGSGNEAHRNNGLGESQKCSVSAFLPQHPFLMAPQRNRQPSTRPSNQGTKGPKEQCDTSCHLPVQNRVCIQKDLVSIYGTNRKRKLKWHYSTHFQIVFSPKPMLFTIKQFLQYFCFP